MPRSYNGDDDHDGRGSRRNRSPDYYSGAGGGPAVGFGDPGRPFRDDAPYEREEMSLMPPAHNYGRANSVPPGNALAYRGRDESPPYARSRGGESSSRRRRSRSRDSDDSRRSRRRDDESPMSRARNAIDDNFTNSSTGIGAGILGAVVGGFVANKASDAAFKGKGNQRRHSGDNHEMVRGVSTLLGAVAGGLGANAFANHIEGEREKRREREHGHRGRDDGSEHRRHSRRDDDYEYDEYDDRRRDDYRRY